MESITWADRFRTLSNIRRLKILTLCKKEHKVSEISKKLKIPLTRTSEYLSNLQKNGLIKKTRNKDNSISIKSLFEVTKNGELKLIK
jgi:predicted transcriptional regulator